MPATAPCPSMKRAMRSSGSKCFSLQAPRSCGEIRPSGVDRRRFGEHQRRAADRARREMGEMPVVGEAVDAGILAHRRNADAIGERDVAQAKRVEQVRHGGAISVWRGDVGCIVGVARAGRKGAARAEESRYSPCPRMAILLGNARVRPLGRAHEPMSFRRRRLRRPASREAALGPRPPPSAADPKLATGAPRQRQPRRRRPHWAF